jgi:hypothetical protein
MLAAILIVEHCFSEREKLNQREELWLQVETLAKKHKLNDDDVQMNSFDNEENSLIVK